MAQICSLPFDQSATQRRSSLHMAWLHEGEANLSSMICAVQAFVKARGADSRGSGGCHTYEPSAGLAPDPV